ncbi:hypothetical protein Bca4012_005887 [Brassica carinata]
MNLRRTVQMMQLDVDLRKTAMGGNAKKRLVQSFVSPRKKAMAKQASKAGDKGPVPTKKALVKPIPDQD